MNYLSSICDINLFKAILAGCLAIILSLFGEDHTGIIVATSLFFIDTITGTFYACSQGRCSSGGFYPAVKKGFVMFNAFLALALITLLHPELGYLLKVFPSLIAVYEFGSIAENLHRIYPNFITEYFLKVSGMMKDGILNKLKDKNQ